MLVRSSERDAKAPDWPSLTRLLAVLGVRLVQVPPVRPLPPPRRPAASGGSWTAAEDELVRTLPPGAAAARTGRSQDAVSNRRHQLQVPDGRKKPDR
jgi:hypothetical protein